MFSFLCSIDNCENVTLFRRLGTSGGCSWTNNIKYVQLRYFSLYHHQPDTVISGFGFGGFWYKLKNLSFGIFFGTMMKMSGSYKPVYLQINPISALRLMSFQAPGEDWKLKARWCWFPPEGCSLAQLLNLHLVPSLQDHPLSWSS